MTREEAIKALNGFPHCETCGATPDCSKCKEALDMAIEALKEKQPEKGEWVIDEYMIYHCPFCMAINNTVYKSFCPNCGADMRKGR